jgi:hypothetical protein
VLVVFFTSLPTKHAKEIKYHTHINLHHSYHIIAEFRVIIFLLQDTRILYRTIRHRIQVLREGNIISTKDGFPFGTSQKPLIHTLKKCTKKHHSAGWCRSKALYLYAGGHTLNLRGLICLPLSLHTNIMTVVSLGYHCFPFKSVQAITHQSYHHFTLCSQRY